MEQNTKNFDRNIEQIMNEHEVAPPFGMWNRISAELEAMPVAAAAASAPVVTSLIPKRAMVGIIAAALVIGSSLLTNYVVSNMHRNDKANTTAVTTSIATSAKSVNRSATEQTIPVKMTTDPAEISLTKIKIRHIAATNPVQSAILAAQQVQPTVNQEAVVLTTATPVIINNDNADVPTPLEPVAKSAVETQTYYFPPIDVNTPVKETTPVAVSKAHTELVPYNGDDKPSRLFGSRNKFHPKKRQKFVYGNIIR